MTDHAGWFRGNGAGRDTLGIWTRCAPQVKNLPDKLSDDADTPRLHLHRALHRLPMPKGASQGEADA